MTAKTLLYGATGYAGGLIAQSAKHHGLEFILGGRTEPSLAASAQQLGFDYRVFSLDNPQAMDHALEGVAVLLNCAGPFSRSANPLVDGCLRTQTHYADIAGEVPEFEALVNRNAEAKGAGIMLLPGVGFGVVPTDCLAAYLKSKLPTAKKLTLVYETQGGVSRGTANVVLPNLHQTGVVRENGFLIPARPAQKTMTIDLGAGSVKAVMNPWRADIVTAFYSTGISTIEVYTVFPKPVRILMQKSNYLAGIYGSSLFQKGIARLIKTLPEGPTEAERAQGKTRVLGIVEDETGNKVTAILEGPEAYDCTALTAVTTIKHILNQEIQPGFQTPASAYGADLILEVPGVQRFEL